MVLFTSIIIAFVFWSTGFVGLAVNDDDMISSPNIPFCRQGHSQITIRATDSYSEQIIIFGGKGINYKQPNTIYMNDLWILKVFPAQSVISTDNVDNMDPSTKYSSSYKSLPNFEWRQVSEMADHVWPIRRWSFGYCSVDLDQKQFPNLVSKLVLDDLVKSSKKLLIFGGESDYYGGFYGDTSLYNTKFLSDLWLLVNETYWMRLYDESDYFIEPNQVTRAEEEIASPLKESSAGKRGYPTIRQQVPGPRKGAILATMPVSQTVVLFGGEGLYVDDKEFSTQSESESGSRDGEDRSGIVIKRITVRCLSELFTINITAAILSHNSNKEVNNDDDGFKKWNVWVRGAKYGGPCLLDAAAVGILDPLDNVEKLFVFGGRFLSPYSSSSGWFAEGSSQSGGSSGEGSYSYNSEILLYEPVAKMWSTIPASSCWPAGRHGHSLSYSHDRRVVLLSGGVKGSTFRSWNSSNSNSNSNSNDGSCPQSCSGEDSGVNSGREMDLWSFDLLSRTWKRLCEQSNTDKPRKAAIRKLLESDSTGQWGSNGLGSTGGRPDGRFLHTTSLIRTPISMEDDGSDYSLQLVVFGGQYHPYNYDLQQQNLQQLRKRTLKSMDLLPERHSEMNDVWIYQQKSLTAVPRPISNGGRGWMLVSRGGCHVGDDGAVVKPIVDTSALFLVYSLVGSALLGMLFYHIMSRYFFSKVRSSAPTDQPGGREAAGGGSLFQIDLTRQRNGYQKIPDIPPVN